jgi:hypothetical protein
MRLWQKDDEKEKEMIDWAYVYLKYELFELYQLYWSKECQLN